MTVLALGRSMQEVDATVTAAGAALTDRSVIWVREDLNMEPAFWAQWPGNFPYIARNSIISSKNLAGFVSLHNFPSGSPAANHWGPAISVFQTASQTAYFYNFHVADLGNFTVVGPSGSGKTVWLSFIAAQAQRVTPRPKLVFVDKDRGAEIFIRALGGQYEALEPGTATGFNPLMLPDGGETREFLYRLFSFLLRPKGGLDTDLSATEEQVIRNAIKTVVSGPREGRNLPAFQSLLRGRIQASESDLASRLEPWIRKDQNGWLFNNAEDRFSLNAIFGFDMTRVLDNPTIRTAALLYIFHRIEELIDGTPIMIFLDEGWRLLDDEVFSYFIKDKLKTLRKQNGIIGFGTQSAADIVRSKAANTLIEQTATNVFFANAKADDESYRRAFQLSDREMRWIRETVPEARSFLIKHGQDSVIAKLDLGGMPEFIKVLSGRTETVAELYSLMERGRERAGSLAADFHGEDGLMRVLLASAFLLASATAALADIPVEDAEQLTQKIQTSALTTTLVPVQQKQRDGQKGIDCATHTGQKGRGAEQHRDARMRPRAPPRSRATIRKCRRRQPLMRLARRWRRKISVQPQGTSSPAIWRRRRRSSATGRPIKTPRSSSAGRRRSWPAMTKIPPAGRRTASAGTRCSQPPICSSAPITRST